MSVGERPALRLKTGATPKKEHATMKSRSGSPAWPSIGATVAAVLIFPLVASYPAGSAQWSGDRWVGTWATAEVGRPQTPPPPAPPLPPFMANQCPAPAAATPPPPAGQGVA